MVQSPSHRTWKFHQSIEITRYKVYSWLETKLQERNSNYNELSYLIYILSHPQSNSITQKRIQKQNLKTTLSSIDFSTHQPKQEDLFVKLHCLGSFSFRQSSQLGLHFFLSHLKSTSTLLFPITTINLNNFFQQRHTTLVLKIHTLQHTQNNNSTSLLSTFGFPYKIWI
jgi:hypothetical protein